MEISLDYYHYNEIFSKMSFPSGEPEMTREESAFLCGLIDEFKPKSVVEVGIAGGGTTAIILQCLDNNVKDYHFWAVDISECFYKDSRKKTGYLGKEAEQIIGIKNGELSFMLGKALPFYLNEIYQCRPIDFILLDTLHMLPGEILDFLAVLPFLNDGAVVCLHDISLNTRSSLRINEIATNVLFNAVVGEKIINYDLVSSELETYPNIAAFQINEDTKKYISNVFGLLSLNWSIIPPREQISIYRELYTKHYDQDCIEIFDRAYNINANMPKGNVAERARKAAKIFLLGKY